jgi:hypothetical protein
MVFSLQVGAGRDGVERDSSDEVEICVGAFADRVQAVEVDGPLLEEDLGHAQREEAVAARPRMHRVVGVAHGLGALPGRSRCRPRRGPGRSSAPASCGCS